MASQIFYLKHAQVYLLILKIVFKITGQQVKIINVLFMIPESGLLTSILQTRTEVSYESKCTEKYLFKNLLKSRL